MSYLRLFAIKRKFGSSLPLVVCMMVHVLFAFVCYSGVNTYCAVFLHCFSSSCLYPMLPVSLDYPFLYCPFDILLRLFPLIKIHTNIICETIANSYWYTSSNICSFLQTTHIKKNIKKVTLFTL